MYYLAVLLHENFDEVQQAKELYKNIIEKRDRCEYTYDSSFKLGVLYESHYNKYKKAFHYYSESKQCSTHEVNAKNKMGIFCFYPSF